MTQAAYVPHPAPKLLNARVALVDGERYSLTCDGGTSLIARRAASCLLVPRVGDRVLCADAGGMFVLAVLERDDVTSAEIAIDGDVAVRATGGSLLVRGDAGVAITSKQEVSVVSDSLAITNQRTELLSRAINAVAVRARASFDDVGILATTCDIIAERIAQRAQRVFRFVSEIDQLRAGHFDYRAERCAQIKGENTVMVARQVAKIDGEQIHVG